MTHHYTNRNPQSEARRQHIYGNLQRPEGEPSILMGALYLVAAAFPLIVLGVMLT